MKILIKIETQENQTDILEQKNTWFKWKNSLRDLNRKLHLAEKEETSSKTELAGKKWLGIKSMTD